MAAPSRKLTADSAYFPGNECPLLVKADVRGQPNIGTLCDTFVRQYLVRRQIQGAVVSGFRCFFVGVLGAVLVLGAAAILVPTYGDFQDRAALDETIGELDPYRDKIARNALSQGSIERSGVGIQISSEDLSRLSLDFARIFPDGTMAVRHAQYHQVVVWEPSIADGKVSWKCIGGPRQSVPPQCR